MSQSDTQPPFPTCPPTDDELLLFVVDDMPHCAMQDYVRRKCDDPRLVDWYDLRWRFVREAQRRGLTD